MLTENDLKEILHYDPDTGLFTWKKHAIYPGKIGKIAGKEHSSGYIIIELLNESHRAHRLVFLYMDGHFPENEIDHINKIRSDNKWNNLREISSRCNKRNSKLSKLNTSGVKGISLKQDTGKWIVQIKVNYIQCYVGVHEDFDDAVLHRLAAEQCLGWHGCDSSSSAYLYAIKNGLVKGGPK